MFRLRSARHTRLFVSGLVVSLVLVACGGGPNISDADYASAQVGAVLSATLAGIDLAEDDSACVVDQSSDQQANELASLGRESRNASGAPALPFGLGPGLAESIVACVGAQDLVTSGLLALTGELSAESTQCAGEAFDHDLLRDLIAARLAGQERSTTAIEIEVGLVVGVCLTPNELLLLHQS